MKKQYSVCIALAVFAVLVPATRANAQELANSLKGRILIQVESKGEAWYINPKDAKRYYMANGSEAYSIMRTLGVGVTNKDLAKIQSDKQVALKQQGKIFLQVESHGEAFYIDNKGVAHYLKDGEAAYGIMRELGLGITNKNLDSIPKSDKDVLAEKTGSQPLPNPTEQNAGVPEVNNPNSGYCDWSGKANIIAPGMNKHAYTYCKLDFSNVASGTNMKLSVQNGGGASKASVDLFPPGAVILSTGRQTDSICYIYDLSSNASDYAACPIAKPGIYTLGMEGNWFSVPDSTNEITYKISKLAN